MQTKSIAMVTISEVPFRNPAQSGDILEFWTELQKIGRTSLSIHCVVRRKEIGGASPLWALQDDLILQCGILFVALDRHGLAHHSGRVEGGEL